MTLETLHKYKSLIKVEKMMLRGILSKCRIVQVILTPDIFVHATLLHTHLKKRYFIDSSFIHNFHIQLD